mgnify:FL=1
MKNLVVTVIVAIVVMASYSQANAQYAIPSYDVPVYSNMTFEDTAWSNGDDSREERKLKVRVETNSYAPRTAWVHISVYNKDTGLSVGPIQVKEGTDFTMNINEDQWGVGVLRSSKSALLSVWTNK